MGSGGENEERIPTVDELGIEWREDN